MATTLVDNRAHHPLPGSPGGQKVRTGSSEGVAIGGRGSIIAHHGAPGLSATVTDTLVPCIADALLGSEIAQVTGNDVDSGPVLWYVLSSSGAPGSLQCRRYGGRLSPTGPLI